MIRKDKIMTNIAPILVWDAICDEFSDYDYSTRSSALHEILDCSDYISIWDCIEVFFADSSYSNRSKLFHMIISLLA